LALFGENPDREGLKETPMRVARAWQELLKGYHQHPAHILGKEFEADGYDQLVLLRGIEFWSTCEHHLLPFAGVAHVGYVPGGRVVGISKLARLVDCFACRLQIQERMTDEIATAIQQHLSPVGVGVVVEARHQCMVCRGVRKQQSVMLTSSLRGCMLDLPSARREFLGLCGY